MNTEITKKQAIMLTVLGIVLVVVCYWQFLMRPVFSSISESKEQAAQLIDQYNNLVQQSESYDQNIQQLEGWVEKNRAETRKLYPLSEPQRIDNILTRVVGMMGAQIVSLNISNLNQYYIDSEGNLITADPSLVEASVDGTTPAEMETAGYTATGEYCRDFTYTIEGNYEDITQVLEFVNDISFLGISSFTFNNIASSEEGQSEKVFTDNYSFTITVTAYMYSDPLTAIDPITDESAAEGAEETAES